MEKQNSQNRDQDQNDVQESSITPGSDPDHATVPARRVGWIVLALAVAALAIGVTVYWMHSRSSGSLPSSSSARTLAPVTTSSNSAALGIDTPTSNDAKAISEIGHTPAIIDDFVTWTDGTGQPTGFPKAFADQVIGLGSMPMITWQPDQAIASKTQSVLDVISSGQEDGLIKQWADSAKAENHVIYVRLMHEMNGGWYPWGDGVNGNTPAMYVTAYRHVVDVFRQEGASNVQFVWCVATSTANDSSSSVNSALASFFPGDDYVAWVAMDGYSRKPDNPKTFSQIFGTVYQSLTAMSHRPVMVPETATVEDPSNSQAKADWITASFLTTIPQQFPRIKAVLYFDSKGKGYTYQIDTSTETLAAIKKVFAAPYYQASAPTSVLSY